MASVGIMADDEWRLMQVRIREAYKTYGPLLEKGERLSPYDLGVDWVFSPIEDNVWGDIRYLALPLYPQYPVGPYFLDFGDPHKKIGIEVDSVAWHKDKAKDKRRQTQIEKLGWEVFRIPSYKTYKTRSDFQDEDGKVDVKRYVAESSEGFLTWIYYGERLARYGGAE